MATDGASSAAASSGTATAGRGIAVGGQEVQVSLRLGDRSRKGRLWCLERKAGVVVLDCPDESATPATTTTRLIRIKHVKDKGFKVNKPAKGQRKPSDFKDVALPEHDDAALDARYREAVARQQKRNNMIGRGVSKEAQHVFDKLSKTLDCRWKDKNILVNHLAVRISPPYGPENVSGKDPKAKQRVKMMVTKFMESYKALQA